MPILALLLSLVPSIASPVDSCQTEIALFWLNFGYISAPPGHFGLGFEANSLGGQPFWTGDGFVNPTGKYSWQHTTMLAKRIELGVTARSIVTRKLEDKVPTWDGRAAALIIEPTLWYFDPNSAIADIGFKTLQPTRPYFVVGDRDGRQTFLEFWIKGFNRNEPPPVRILSEMLYR